MNYAISIDGWDFFSQSKYESVKHSEYELIVKDILKNIEKGKQNSYYSW